MAALLPISTCLNSRLPSDHCHFFPNPSLPFRLQFIPRKRSLNDFYCVRAIHNLKLHSSSEPTEQECQRQTQKAIRLAGSAVIIFCLSLGFGFGLRSCCAASILSHAPAYNDDSWTEEENQIIQGDNGRLGNREESEEKEMEAAFEAWKSKKFALTVPLKIVALRGSVPPSWIKDFMQSQGKRSRLDIKFNLSLEGIFNELSMPLVKGKVGPSSIVAADIISVGDSWLNFAVKRNLIEAFQGVEDQEWFNSLSDKWKVLLRRNSKGERDPEGKIWAAPYRWGCMVIAYKKSKFRNQNLAPVEDWADLWRPELAKRISMVDSPREVIGAVLKYMGASYNTNNINLQVAGGREAVQQSLALLARQVRLFDSTHYLKAFGVGDVWVAVGWSSDVLPVVKRMSDVAVVVPKSGSSLWADLWAIPAASKLETDQIGGRVRGPSPLVHQWIEFCLQTARALPFKQEVIPGASPAAIESSIIEVPKELADGKPRLDTNLVAGVPPGDILDRCELLEPLSDSALTDYSWLIANMQKPNGTLINRIHSSISSLIQYFSLKLHSKVT